MKKIYLLAFLLGILTLSSCEDDKTPVLELKAPAQLEALPQAEYAITAANAEQDFVIKWQPADYGFQAVVDYSVYLTNKKNNKTVRIGDTKDNQLTLKYADLNNYLGKINVYPGNAEDIAVTLDYTAYSGKLDTEGEGAIEFKATTFDPKAVEWDYVYVAVGYPDWDWTQAYLLGDVDGDGTYEGYADFQSDNITYRVVDGKTLQPIGEEKTVEAKGFYKVAVDDAGAVTQSGSPIIWGLIGDATPGGWNNDTQMEYDPETRLWTKGVRLLKGKEYKFRGNNDWGINFGAVQGHASDMGSELVADGSNIIVVADVDTIYRVELNLTQAGKYSYTLAETSFVPSSEYITIPGSYQDWKPEDESAYKLTSPARDYIFTGAHYMPDNTEFKFYDKGSWMGIDGTISWNDDRTGGSFTLGGNNILFEKGDYYKFTVNTDKKTCTFIKTGWGIVGSGSPSGDWNIDAMLTYNPANGTWYGTFDFIGGEIKFRWDRDWVISLGGTLEALTSDNGSNIPVAAGNYTVVLDPVGLKATMTKN